MYLYMNYTSYYNAFYHIIYIVIDTYKWYVDVHMHV